MDHFTKTNLDSKSLTYLSLDLDHSSLQCPGWKLISVNWDMINLSIDSKHSIVSLARWLHIASFESSLKNSWLASATTLAESPKPNKKFALAVHECNFSCHYDNEAPQLVCDYSHLLFHCNFISHPFDVAPKDFGLFFVFFHPNWSLAAVLAEPHCKQNCSCFN